MATTDMRLHAELTADDQMSKVFKQAQDAAGKLQKGFKTMQEDAGKFATEFGVIAGVGVAALTTFVNSAMESDKVVAQLGAVLKSTGGAAGMTADAAINLASSLQRVTTVNDEAILTGENMLLTFTNIHKDVFPKVTETMLDMAVAMNGGATPSAEALSSQAIQLGKALNDPTKGLTALTRVGVSFTEEQKKSIETMQKHGDIMGAQKVILAELSKEFGGSAAAAANTFGGSIEQMKNRLDDVFETLGKSVIPVIQQFTKYLGDMLTWFENLTPKQKEFWAQTVMIGTALAAAVAGVALLIVALNPITIAVAAVVAGFAYLTMKLNEQGMSWEEFGVSVQVVWAQFRYNVEFNVDLIIWQMRRLTLATDKELQDLAAQMDAHLEITNQEVLAGQNKLVQIYQSKQLEQKKAIEDGIAAQRDVVDKSTGEVKDAARKQLEQMKTEGIKQFSDLKLGSTAELAKMRSAEEAELAKTNAMVAEKFNGQVKSAITWGEHLISNLSSGIWGKMPVLDVAIAGAQAIMNMIHQSYNPDLPAQLWGQHFLENFAAGMKDSAPKVFTQTEEMKAALRAEYGSDGDIAKLMKEWTKDKSIQTHFQEIADKVKENGKKITDEFDAEKKSYDDLNLKAGQALADLQKKHETTLNEIGKKITDTMAKIKDLNENYKINVQSADNSLGAEVVNQQDLVANLQKQIADAQSKGTDTTDLQSQYDKEFAALQTFMANTSGLESEIAEARRRSNLTDFERFIEDTNARKAALAEEHTAKLALLEAEKTSLQDQRDKENVIYQASMVQMRAVQLSFKSMQDAFTTGLNLMQTTAQAKLTSINGMLAQMQAAMDKMAAFNSGETPAPSLTSSTVPKKFAVGGVVTSPTFAMIGEGGMNEAVVPLPNGRSIPVQISGGTGSGSITVNMNFGDVQIAKEVDADSFFAKMEDRLTRAIQLQKLGSIA